MSRKFNQNCASAAVAPVVQRAACPEGRSVGAPCERAPVVLLRGVIFWHSWSSSAHQLTVLQNNPRHTARTNTNTSATNTIQINAFWRSGGGGRGASPEKWVHWSCLNLRRWPERQDCSAHVSPSPIYQGIQTREEISWHKVASGWIWSSQSVAVAIATTRSKPTQEPRENVAAPSQSIGSGGSRAS